MSYAWIIDKDHFNVGEDDEYNRRGVIGPYHASSERLSLLDNSVGEKFRMLDDDRNVIYEGRIIGNYSMFEPLDDFGGPDAGCTIIQYRVNGKWEDT